MTLTSDAPTGVANLELRQGQTWSQPIVICDSTLVALDFSTGYTATMQVRKFANAADVLVELTSVSGITLQAGVNDEANPNNIVANVILNLADEATAALEAGSFVYDLFVEETGSDTNVPWLAGKFIVRQAVTRA